jgi:hypothetical protein
MDIFTIRNKQNQSYNRNVNGKEQECVGVFHVCAVVRWCGRCCDWLRNGRPRIRSSSPSKVKNLQTDSEVHPASYPFGTARSFRVVKRQAASRRRKRDLYMHFLYSLHSVELSYLSTGIALLSRITRPPSYLGQTIFCKIWGFHGGDYEEWCLLGCYAVWLL